MSGKLVEERLRLLQIRRVKPLGEPVVHRSQQVVGVLALVLGLPQTTYNACCLAPGSWENMGRKLLLQQLDVLPTYATAAPDDLNPHLHPLPCRGQIALR